MREWKRSGLTQVEFAAGRGISLGTLRAWCRRLGEAPRSGAAVGPTDAVPARFVEVRMAAHSAAVAEIELHLGAGLVLRFGGSVAPEFVGAVVAAVRERAC